MGNVLGFVGQIVGSAIQAKASKDALRMQLNAVKKQQELLYNSLDPNIIGPQATGADILRAEQQLALQGQIDPALLQTRYASEYGLKSSLDQILQSGSPANKVAQAATEQALTQTPAQSEAKNKLIDAALANLKAGATLPPDVEAQLVQHGLEKTGMATGRATAQGVGGTMLRTILGDAGIKLQAQREAQAAQLLAGAQQLDTARSQVLQSLFPNLQAQQIQKLAASGSAFGAASGAVPEVGLSGTNIANIWMARVGAMNSLSQSAADSAARNAMAQGQIWGNAIGGATRATPGVYSDLKNLWSGGGSKVGEIGPGQTYDPGDAVTSEDTGGGGDAYSMDTESTD